MFRNCSPRLLFILGLMAGVTLVSAVAFIFIWLILYKDVKDIRDTVVINNSNSSVSQNILNLDNVKVSPIDNSYGNTNAQVVLIEFADLEDQYSSRFNGVISSVVEKYKTEVRWVYKHFYLSSRHVQAQDAAVAAQCAGQQGKFFEYAGELFANQDKFDSDYYKQVAAGLNLDSNVFSACLNDGSILAKVKADYYEALESGLRGTPNTVLINKNGERELIDGYLSAEELEDKIEQALK